MSREVMKQALEALIWTTGSDDFGDGGKAREGALKLLFPSITALRERLAQPEQEPLTPRETELIDGMIEVQLRHAERCDSIPNRNMADKQKGWDMERVALLRKLKAAHGIKGKA